MLPSVRQQSTGGTPVQQSPSAPSATFGVFHETADDLLPIAILMDELKHDDIATRLSSVRKLRLIALALGPDRTRDELVPFLEESLEDEDEVLLALAGELGGLADLLGGAASYAHILLPSLETLAAAEETVVRDKAIESIGRIATSFTPAQTEEYFVPLVRRLSGGDWFTCKTSACGLFHYIYPSSSPSVKSELRKTYAALVNDDTPMVRRAAATHLPSFARTIAPEDIRADILPMFYKLAGDEQDSVRLLAVSSFICIAKILEPEETNSKLFPTLINLIHDLSWRVRFNASKLFFDIAEACRPLNVDLSDPFADLLRDGEAEVRAIAATQIPLVCKILSVDTIISKLVPCFKELVTDPNQHVRSAIAQNLTAVAPIIGKQHTIDYLMELFLLFLRDEFSEVRLNFISRLEIIHQVVGLDLLHHSLLPSVIELSEDKQWRVRLAIIDYVPLLAQLFGETFYNEKLGSRSVGWLCDPVFMIREAACVNLSNISKSFGNSWATAFALPNIEPMTTSQVYLHRLTSVQALFTLALALGKADVQSKVMPLLVRLASDPVPNIRFGVARALERLMPQLQPQVDAALEALLTKMASDTDNDVRQYAARAMAAI